MQLQITLPRPALRSFQPISTSRSPTPTLSNWARRLTCNESLSYAYKARLTSRDPPRLGSGNGAWLLSCCRLHYPARSWPRSQSVKPDRARHLVDFFLAVGGSFRGRAFSGRPRRWLARRSFPWAGSGGTYGSLQDPRSFGYVLPTVDYRYSARGPAS